MSKKHFAKKHGRMVLPGQIWIDRHNIERRVMVVAEGYAMVRAKGCSPFTVPVKAMDDEWRFALGKPVGSHLVDETGKAPTINEIVARRTRDRHDSE